MKAIKIILFLIIFETLIIGTTFNVVAVDNDDEDYQIGLKEDKEFIYVCNTFDQEKMEEAWGKNWDDNLLFKGIGQGRKMKWLITAIDEDDKMESIKTRGIEKAYNIKYDIWNWTDEDKFVKGDEEEQEFAWFADPEDCETDKAINDIYVPWVPIKAIDYLDHLELYKWWYTDENKLIYERFGSERENWYNPDIHKDDIIIEMTFNDDGLLASYKVMNEDEEVILEFSLENEWMYIIPVVVAGVIIVAALAIIFFILRKKGIKFLKRKGEVEKNE